MSLFLIIKTLLTEKLYMSSRTNELVAILILPENTIFFFFVNHYLYEHMSFARILKTQINAKCFNIDIY